MHILLSLIITIAVLGCGGDYQTLPNPDSGPTQGGGSTTADGGADGGPSTYAKTALVAACEGIGGGSLNVLGDNVSTPVLPLPFAFTYFGQPTNGLSITSNGFVQLWPTSGTPSTSTANPTDLTAGEVPGVVAPFWDDLLMADDGALVRVHVFGTAPLRRLVIEWWGWAFYSPAGPSTDSLRFQLKLYETTNVLEFHYCELVGRPPGLRQQRQHRHRRPGAHLAGTTFGRPDRGSLQRRGPPLCAVVRRVP